MTARWIRVALVLLLACSPAWANSKLEPPDLARYLRWGPLRARPGLELSNFGYDDNILSSSVLQVSDITATLSPKLDGLLLMGDRAFLTFEEKLEFTGYLEYSDQNYINQRGSARVTFPLERIGFFVDGVLNRINERPVDLEDIRPQRDERGYGAGIILVPGWRTEIEIGSSYLELRYSDRDQDPQLGQSIDQRLDRDEDSTNIKATYRIAGRTRLALDARFGTIDFVYPLASTHDSRAISLLPGVDFGEGGTLTGTFRLGWAKIDAEEQISPDLSELVGKADLVYRPSPRTTFRLTARREPGFTVGGDSVYFLHSRVKIGAVRYLNRIFGVEASGTAGRLTFPSSLTLDDREDDLLLYDAGVRFRLSENEMGRRVEYSLTLGRYERTSTDPLAERSRTTFGIGAVVGF